MTPGERRKDLRRVVEDGDVPGLLAYRAGAPVGWVAVQPRAAYAALARSRNLKPADDAPVWSVTCFFVPKAHRRTGLQTALLKEAVAHARKAGAPAIEGYPIVADALRGCDGYMGLVPAFERAGFREVARPTRRIRVMRRDLP